MNLGIEAPLPATLEEAHAEIRAFRQLVAELTARVEVLEARLSLNSGNSSKPPSSDGPRVKLPPKKQPTGRKAGGQPGHKGSYRQAVPPERVNEVVDHWPCSCANCHASLPQSQRTEVGEPVAHQQIEIPPLVAHVTEHRLHAQLCEACDHTTRAELPAGIPRGAFGVRLQAVIALLTGAYHISRRLAQSALGDLFGVELSLGSVTIAEQAMSEALAAPVAEARQHVQAQPVRHADETGWWERHKRAWLWVAGTPLVAVFLVHTKRGAEAAKALLGEMKQGVGVLVTDRWSAYSTWALLWRQICWAHLKRDFQFIAECPGPVSDVGHQLLAAARELFKLWYRVRDGTMNRGEFQTAVGPLRERVETLLRSGAASGHARVSGMCTKMLKVFPAFWTFVTVEGVEPTNNFAERLIRAAVLWRKRSFGTHSEQGSRFAERMLTVVATLKLQDRNVLDYLVEAGQASIDGQPVPSLLPTLAA